jgi:hypothetical protein
MKSNSAINIYSSGLKILLSLIFSAFSFQQSFSQNANSSLTDSGERDFKEQLFLRTDRDIYVTGEEIFLKIYKFSALLHSPSDLSKVVYVELLDKNNFPVRQVKVKTQNTGSTSFVIPGNISSGNYLIRAYTSWMENFSTDQFTYKVISVINPFESIDHLKIPEAGNEIYSHPGIISGSGKLIKESSVAGKDEKISYRVNLIKNNYSPREKVIMEIIAHDRNGNPVESDLSVSIVRSAVVNTDQTESFLSALNDTSLIVRSNGKEHLAELEGHLLSGSIVSKKTGEPLKKIELSLSYVGKTARCQFGKTDDNGNFNFIIRESGRNEIVIQPLNPTGDDYYVDLIQPFSSTFSKFKAQELALDSNKIDELNKVIIGMQINNIYQPFRQSSPEEAKPNIPDFFGKPEHSIKMSDYIELTSLKEAVKEIIPDVYTMKQNFKLINKFKGLPFENKPLILLDGVPVYDFEKVLSINSREVEKADIINTRYFYSDNIIDGIVSFVTKKGNLSVLDYNSSIFRQVYEGCQNSGRFYSPDYSSATDKNNRIPDYRNTLYWTPDLHTGKDGKAEIEFYTSDVKSDYKIVVEGMSADGKTGYSSSALIVK